MSSDSTQRVSLPAGRDPNRNPDGTFADGNRASPGRKKGSGNFTRLLREAYESTKSTELVQRLAVAKVVAHAGSLGLTIEPEEVEGMIPPGTSTPQEFAVWVNSLLGVTSLEHQREYTDRESPKPRRLEHSGPDGGPMRMLRNAVASSADQGEAAAAGAYLDELPGTEEE